MTLTEFSSAGAKVGVTSQIEAARGKELVVRNSRFLIGVTLSCTVLAAFMSACMVLVAMSQVFPVSALTSDRGWAAFRWMLSASAMGSMCPWLWNLGRAMSFCRVVMDRRGADFRLGTKKNPEELFMGWDQVVSVKRRRAGNFYTFAVTAADGSEARYTSYTFFRPQKLARLIAERAGVTIEKS